MKFDFSNFFFIGTIKLCISASLFSGFICLSLLIIICLYKTYSVKVLEDISKVFSYLSSEYPEASKTSF